MTNRNMNDPFEKVYYKVINYDTKEVIFEKEFTKNIGNKLGMKPDAVRRAAISNKKKPYYTHRKTGVNYKFIRIEN